MSEVEKVVKEERQRVAFETAMRALQEIANYQDPEDLNEGSEDEYGVSGSEAIEMAYENVIWTAQRALENVDRALNPKRQTA